MKRALAPRILLLLATLAVTLTALEIGARLWVTRLAGDADFLRYAAIDQIDEKRLAASRDGTNRRYSTHRYLGYIPTPGYSHGANRHNSLGYRGDEFPLRKPDGEFRIVCIGGSTTYTEGVEDYHFAYPQQLEVELHRRGYSSVRVVNAGAESHSSWESLITLEFRVVDLEPDLIVLYEGVNDIHARVVWPKEAYRGDNSGWRVPMASAIVTPGVLEHSTLARIFLVRFEYIRPQSDLSRNIDPNASTFYAPAFWRQYRIKQYPSGPFREVPVAQMMAANPPVFFERNLRSMVAVARVHGARTLLLSTAHTHVFGDPDGASQEYRGALAEMNAVVRKVASEAGAEFYDLADGFPIDRKYWKDGEHVNFRGSILKARRIADHLVAAALLPALAP